MSACVHEPLHAHAKPSNCAGPAGSLQAPHGCLVALEATRPTLPTLSLMVPGRPAPASCPSSISSSLLRFLTSAPPLSCAPQLLPLAQTAGATPASAAHGAGVQGAAAPVFSRMQQDWRVGGCVVWWCGGVWCQEEGVAVVRRVPWVHKPNSGKMLSSACPRASGRGATTPGSCWRAPFSTASTPWPEPALDGSGPSRRWLLLHH